MDRNLMKAVVDVCLFLSTCDDDECDPDSAVEVLEGIASNLRKLKKKQLSEFANFCQELADQEEDPDISGSIATIPEELGLV